MVAEVETLRVGELERPGVSVMVTLSEEVGEALGESESERELVVEASFTNERDMEFDSDRVRPIDGDVECVGDGVGEGVGVGVGVGVVVMEDVREVLSVVVTVREVLNVYVGEYVCEDDAEHE